MDLPEPTRQFAETSGLRLRHPLAGMEAGILGVLPMLGTVMIGGLANQHSAWFFPNLLGSTLYTLNMTSDNFSRVTLAGIALMVVGYGLLGGVWGAVWRERHIPFAPAMGAVTGLILNYALFHWIGPRVNPIVALYAPTQQLRIAHILWGIILSQSPAYARRIAAGGVSSAPDDQSDSAPPAQISAGEHFL